MVDAINRNLYQNQLGLQKAQTRIASGKRINNAADDAAGLALANRFSTRIDGFAQSVRNAADGQSLIQTAEAGLQSITDNLQRIRELALQSANGTLNDSDRRAINAEASALGAEIDRVVQTGSFNGISLFKSQAPIQLQVGPDAGDQIAVQTGDLQTELAALAEVDLGTAAGATASISVLDDALTRVDAQRASLGATANRLDANISNLLNSGVQAAASRSRIEDADYAREVSELAQSRVREQVGTALRVQANADAQRVLRLLQ